MPSGPVRVHFYTSKLRKGWTTVAGRRARGGGTSGGQQMGATCLPSAGTAEGQEKNRLCQFHAQPSLLSALVYFLLCLQVDHSLLQG